MNRVTLIVIVIIVIILLYLWYTRSKTENKPPPPLVIPKLTVPVMATTAPITTNYPITEQVIILNYPNSIVPYTTKASQAIIDTKFAEKQTSIVLNSMYGSQSNKRPPFPPTILCYAPYTTLFKNAYQKGLDVFESEYDIIGAYFFLTLSRIPNLPSDAVVYDDLTKKILITTDNLKKILDYWKCSETNQFLISGLMLKGGMLLDDFVKRISRYLFANYKNNNPGDWYNINCT
jgi:hypothetical protein